jgi:hypothetical protein
VTVYQLVRSDGSIEEYTVLSEARIAASKIPGARVRTTTKFVPQ